jgi:hypothetical protein
LTEDEGHARIVPASKPRRLHLYVAPGRMPDLPIQFNSRHQARGIWVRSGTTPASIALLSCLFEPLSGAAPFFQQASARPASSANICQQHLLLTALNLNSQHLNGPASAPASGPSISSISSISASISMAPASGPASAPASGPASQASQPASGRLTRVLRALCLYPLYWGVPRCLEDRGILDLQRTWRATPNWTDDDPQRR